MNCIQPASVSGSRSAHEVDSSTVLFRYIFGIKMTAMDKPYTRATHIITHICWIPLAKMFYIRVVATRVKHELSTALYYRTPLCATLRSSIDAIHVESLM